MRGSAKSFKTQTRTLVFALIRNGQLPICIGLRDNRSEWACDRAILHGGNDNRNHWRLFLEILSVMRSVPVLIDHSQNFAHLARDIEVSLAGAARGVPDEVAQRRIGNECFQFDR